MISCGTEEYCPEHEEQLICGADAFVGTWEYVGTRDEIRERDCLGSMIVSNNPETDIEIEFHEDSNSELKLGYGIYHMYYEDSKGNEECSAETKPSGLFEVFFTRSRITLRNPNQLEVYSRFISAGPCKIYRRKN